MRVHNEPQGKAHGTVGLTAEAEQFGNLRLGGVRVQISDAGVFPQE